ncbi:peptidoglycan DD-metalloendopeptidase family protein [Deefgea tanakiae]|uniref:Peptidoglycan DD-metalloendopeptidase family protein n=1 Tax=Deefgea tanakiae TaxID=2865840 RepID=A0ABX8ZB89_9NEIS|nr:peptidoglycan DD-metalloendopeptidase family protein [Deefgea tanakiae]QZA79055.1 peptidoglycan DD-metalloendopeptidase family protein [Deefgea tanakiae]
MSVSRLSIVSALFLCACSSNPRTPAPIVDKAQSSTVPATAPTSNTIATLKETSNLNADTYTVKAGEGLYRIALDHGLAYKDLAAWNGIADINSLRVGQVLRLSPGGAEQNSGVEVRPLTDSASISSTGVPLKREAVANGSIKKFPRAVKEGYSEQAASSIAGQADGEKVVLKQQNSVAGASGVTTKPNGLIASGAKVENADKTSSAEVPSSAPGNTTAANWGAPTAGKVTTPFTVERKGIDIAGQMGQSIVASGSGKVVYAGAGLRGYGKMIIVQHADGFLSAYAHNSKLIVKENDVVKKGEKIAEMGNTDSDQVKLHFELRKFGKPVDPSNYIKLN